MPTLHALLPLAGVRAGGREVAARAVLLGRSEHDFIREYPRLRPQCVGLALIDTGNGECIFHDGRDCRVQAVKPDRCREFPHT